MSESLVCDIIELHRMIYSGFELFPRSNMSC